MDTCPCCCCSGAWEARWPAGGRHRPMMDGQCGRYDEGPGRQRVYAADREGVRGDGAVCWVLWLRSRHHTCGRGTADMHMREGSSEGAGKAAIRTCSGTTRICFVPPQARAPNATPTLSMSTARQSPYNAGSGWRCGDKGPLPPPPPPQPVHSCPTAATKRGARAHRCGHACHCL